MKKILLAAALAFIAAGSQAQTKSKVYNCSAYGVADGAIDLIVSGGRPPYSYQWSNGSTEEDLNGLASGRYTVTITDSGSRNGSRGCSLEISFDVAQPLGTAKVDNTQPATLKSGDDLRTVYTSRFDVYPNPVENVANVMFYNSDGAGFDLRVTSTAGTEVFAETVKDLKGEYNQKVDFTGLAKGIYFVSIKSQKETITRQIVVQ